MSVLDKAVTPERAWRDSEPVRRFASPLVPGLGGLFRFDGVAPAEIASLLQDAPHEVRVQASDGGPNLVTVVDFASRFGGLLGGFLSVDEREDVVFFCDTVVIPSECEEHLLAQFEPDDVTLCTGGKLKAWWD